MAATGSGPDQAWPGARKALALLVLINLFNYIDRQVLSAVLPRLELDSTLFEASDPSIKFKLGLLTSAFLISYMLFSPLVGWLDGHGYRRWWILGAGVAAWSLASGGSGFATAYGVLLLTRCCVGIGEGAYGPVASAMLADIFPLRQRGTVMALFNMAIPVGSALGFVIGGLVADWTNDWRPAFWVTFIGLILAVVCVVQKEPPRPKSATTTGPIPSYVQVVGRMMRNRSFVLCCLGMTAITFVIGGVAAWVPMYVFQREGRFVITNEVLAKLEAPPPSELKRPVPPEVIAKLRPLVDQPERTGDELKKTVMGLLTREEVNRDYELIALESKTAASPSLGLINTIFGGIVVLGGFAATAAGAWLGEKLRVRIRGAYFLVIGGGALFALPSYLAFLYVPFPVGWVFVFLAVFGLFLHTGPGFTIIANVVTSDVRATAFAINILVIHALGDVISPPLIGLIADLSNLHTAFLTMSVMIVAGGLLWFAGASSLERDTVVER